MFATRKRATAVRLGIRFLAALTIGILAMLATTEARVFAGDVDNVGNFPPFTQAGDYTTAYAGRATDLFGFVGNITYDNLAPDASVRVKEKEWPFVAQVTPNDRDFVPADYADIIGGTYHCFPTAAAIWLSWLAQERGMPEIVTAGEDAFIRVLALYMDTNDVNVSLNTGDELGHFGTFWDDAVSGTNAYLRSQDSRLRVGKWDWSEDAYKRQIDGNRPVVIFYKNANSGIGHVVVGVGYSGTDAKIIDPADPTPTPKTKPFSEIKSPLSPGGTSDKPYGGHIVGFDDEWQETLVMSESSVGGVAELPDVAAAPLETEGSSGLSAGGIAGITAGVAALAVALSGGAWYVRRRVTR